MKNETHPQGPDDSWTRKTAERLGDTPALWEVVRARFLQSTFFQRFDERYYDAETVTHYLAHLHTRVSLEQLAAGSEDHSTAIIFDPPPLHPADPPVIKPWDLVLQADDRLVVVESVTANRLHANRQRKEIDIDTPHQWDDEGLADICDPARIDNRIAAVANAYGTDNIAYVMALFPDVLDVPDDSPRGKRIQQMLTEMNAKGIHITRLYPLRKKEFQMDALEYIPELVANSALLPDEEYRQYLRTRDIEIITQRENLAYREEFLALEMQRLFRRIRTSHDERIAGPDWFFEYSETLENFAFDTSFPPPDMEALFAAFEKTDYFSQERDVKKLAGFFGELYLQSILSTIRQGKSGRVYTDLSDKQDQSTKYSLEKDRNGQMKMRNRETNGIDVEVDAAIKTGKHAIAFEIKITEDVPESLGKAFGDTRLAKVAETIIDACDVDTVDHVLVMPIDLVFRPEVNKVLIEAMRKGHMILPLPFTSHDMVQGVRDVMQNHGIALP